MRNTTLPHPVGVKANAATTEEDLQAKEPIEVRVGLTPKIKGEMEVIEGKLLCSPRLVERGRALKHGVKIENEN